MITPMVTGVDVHPLPLVDGRPAQLIVTERGTVAFVYGEDQLDEVTLVVQACCPVSGDVRLRLGTCGCAEYRVTGLEVARRAPLGAFVYLRDATEDEFADVLVLLAHLPEVRRVFLPLPSVGDTAFLRSTTSYEVVHRPTIVPTNDPTWPYPRGRRRGRLPATLREFWDGFATRFTDRGGPG